MCDALVRADTACCHTVWEMGIVPRRMAFMLSFLYCTDVPTNTNCVLLQLGKPMSAVLSVTYVLRSYSHQLDLIFITRE